MKVRFSTRARLELDTIYTYIAEHNPSAAARVKGRIRQSTEQLGHSPYIGPEAEIPNVRVWSASPYPYRIYYVVRHGEVVILHIRHTSRRPPGIDDF